MDILLTKSTTPIIGWIAWLMGWIMNGIYEALNAVGIPNIGLAIILYTVIIYIAMTPLQIKQQKSSKMMSIVNPELQKIQKKYAGKNDQTSRMKMQEETMALYSKYGISMSGSCVTLAIQMPLLFALYQVIYRIPGYIVRVGNTFGQLAAQIMQVDGYKKILKSFISANHIRMVGGKSLNKAGVIDFLYQLKPSQWDQLSGRFENLSGDIEKTKAFSAKINQFAGINITQTPWDVIRSSIKSHAWLLLIIAILVPVLAWFTQWLNYKLMPQAANDDKNKSTTGNTMNAMNNIMPVFSAFLCLTFSMGIGIYWIAGAIIRCVQQVVNRRIGKMDAEVLIAQAREKQEKKEAKKGNVTRQSSGTNITSNARQSARRYVEPKYKDLDKKEIDYSVDMENLNPKSITAKANLVAKFDEEHSRKKNRTSNRSSRRKRQAAGNAEKAEQTGKKPETSAAAEEKPADEAVQDSQKAEE